MQPDLTFDFYQIVMWDDMRYRVSRLTLSKVGRPDLLSRDAGGRWCWRPKPEKSESWETAQNACLSLSEALTQHGVIG